MKNLWTALLILAAISVSADERPQVFNAPDSPVTITSFDVDFAGDGPVVRMRVRNQTADVVKDAMFELFAFTTDGEIEAVYSFSTSFPISAGGEILLVRRGELLDFTREQSIVATPVAALYSNQRWEIPRDTAVAVARSVILHERGLRPTAASDSAPKSLGVVTQPELHAGLTCDMQCERAQTRCDSTCSGGGVKEFTCACDPNGGISTKCSCYARPK